MTDITLIKTQFELIRKRVRCGLSFNPQSIDLHDKMNLLDAIDALIVAYEKENRMRLHACEDWAGEDTKIREAAKRVLPVEVVDGDGDRFVDVSEVVAALVAEVERIRNRK